MHPLKTSRRFIRNITNAVRGVPAVVLANILLTRRCTQRCRQCTIPQNPGDNYTLPMDDYRWLVDMLDRHGSHFVSLSGGEPILHPEFDECIRYAARRDFVHVQLLSTLYAGEETVERAVDALVETGAGIQISFDGFGEVADRIRGAKNVSDTVLRGVHLLTRKNRSRKRSVRMSANIVISGPNLHQVPDIIRLFENLGWRLNVDLYRWSSDNQREIDEMKVDDTPELRRVLDIVRSSPAVTTPRPIIDRFPDYLAHRTPKRCPYLASRGFGTKIYINPDMSVSVCLGEPFGNLREQTIGDLFSSDDWKDRMKLLNACRGCWNSCYTPSGIAFHPTTYEDLKAIWNMYRKG